MKKLLLAVALLSGCASQTYMNDTPQMAPGGSSGAIQVETVDEDTVCVTENDVRTCVPIARPGQGGS